MILPEQIPDPNRPLEGAEIDLVASLEQRIDSCIQAAAVGDNWPCEAELYASARIMRELTRRYTAVGWRFSFRRTEGNQFAIEIERPVTVEAAHSDARFDKIKEWT